MRIATSFDSGRPIDSRDQCASYVFLRYDPCRKAQSREWTEGICRTGRRMGEANKDARDPVVVRLHVWPLSLRDNMISFFL